MSALMVTFLSTFLLCGSVFTKTNGCFIKWLKKTSYFPLLTPIPPTQMIFCCSSATLIYVDILDRSGLNLSLWWEGGVFEKGGGGLIWNNLATICAHGECNAIVGFHKESKALVWNGARWLVVITTGWWLSLGSLIHQGRKAIKKLSCCAFDLHSCSTGL